MLRLAIRYLAIVAAAPLLWHPFGDAAKRADEDPERLFNKRGWF